MSSSNATTIPPSPTNSDPSDMNTNLSKLALPLQPFYVNQVKIPNVTPPLQIDANKDMHSCHISLPSYNECKRNSEKLPSIRSLLVYANIWSLPIRQHSNVGQTSICSNDTCNQVTVSTLKQDEIPSVKDLMQSVEEEENCNMQLKKLFDIVKLRQQNDNSIRLEKEKNKQLKQPVVGHKLFVCLPVRKPIRKRNLNCGVYSSHIQWCKEDDKETALMKTRMQLSLIHNVFLHKNGDDNFKKVRTGNGRWLKGHHYSTLKNEQINRTVYLCNVVKVLSESLNGMMKIEKSNLCLFSRNNVRICWNAYETMKSEMTMKLFCSKSVDTLCSIFHGIQLKLLKRTVGMKSKDSKEDFNELLENIVDQIGRLYYGVLQEGICIEWCFIISNSLVLPVLQLVQNTGKEGRNILVDGLQKVIRSCTMYIKENEKVTVDQMCRLAEIGLNVSDFFTRQEIEVVKKEIDSLSLYNSLLMQLYVYNDSMI